eukprot:scaffold208876_cov33-Tisochrysis_lutea.AAC.1
MVKRIGVKVSLSCLMWSKLASAPAARGKERRGDQVVNQAAPTIHYVDDFLLAHTSYPSRKYKYAPYHLLPPLQN